MNRTRDSIQPAVGEVCSGSSTAQRRHRRSNALNVPPPAAMSLSAAAAGTAQARWVTSHPPLHTAAANRSQRADGSMPRLNLVGVSYSVTGRKMTAGEGTRPCLEMSDAGAGGGAHA